MAFSALWGSFGFWKLDFVKQKGEFLLEGTPKIIFKHGMFQTSSHEWQICLQTNCDETSLQSC